MTKMTYEQIQEYIEEMDSELFDKVTDAIEEHKFHLEKVAEKFDIPFEVIEDLSWLFVED